MILTSCLQGKISSLGWELNTSFSSQQGAYSITGLGIDCYNFGISIYPHKMEITSPSQDYSESDLKY